MKEYLEQLLEGNHRFSEGKSKYKNSDKVTRKKLIQSQKPYAAILACADSRVPVELLFDVGFGEVFVIRNAGHVLSKEALGSIEYAVEHLGVRMIMVLGHQNCGAIKTAIESFKAKKEPASDYLKALVSHIYPVLETCDINNPSEAEDANINFQLNDLTLKSKFLDDKLQNHEIFIVGAKYSLESGLVSVLTTKD